MESRDIFYLKLISYTGYKRPLHEIFKESCYIARKIIDDDLKEEVKNVQLFFCNALIDEDKREEIIMIIKENSGLYNLGFDEGVEGVAKNMKDKGFDLKDIIEATNLSKEEIIKL